MSKPLHMTDTNAHPTATETTIGVARVATIEEVTSRVTTGTEPAFITPETLPVAIPVGTELLWPATTPPEGWLDESLDLGELPRMAYPQLWEFAEKSGNIIDETEWQNRKTALGFVGAFSSGNGIDTFRIPLVRRAFMRAADPVTGLLPGTEQGDAIRNITGEVDTALKMGVIGTGAMQTTAPGRYLWTTGSSGTAGGSWRFDASLVVPTADENRPVAIARLPIIKAFGAVSEIATLEVAELLSKINLVSSQVNSPAHVQELAGTIIAEQPTFESWVASSQFTWQHNLNLTAEQAARASVEVDAKITASGTIHKNCACISHHTNLYWTTNNNIITSTANSITVSTPYSSAGRYQSAVVTSVLDSGGFANNSKIALRIRY